MGKILTTTYQDSVQQLTGFYNTLVNNPFYQFNEKKPTICTYYSIDKDYSSVDPGSKLIMDNIGTESPLRFNRIYDFILYGFDKIQLQTDLDEFGLESDKISGECIIIPNNFVPLENDYFEVEHIKDSTYLFMVTDVQKDTLNNGSNAYKISYRLEYNTNRDLSDLVVHNYRSIEVREGTNISKTVRCEDYDIAKLMDDIAVSLKKYFCDLFYNDKVQTFIFEDLTEYRIYDQFMIEFLMRNKVLANGEDGYIHLDHIIPVQKTFSIDYDKSIFRAFELKEIDKLLKSKRNVVIEYINEYGSIFASRYETYYKAAYVDTNYPSFSTCCLGDDLIYNITDHKLVDSIDEDETKPELWKNIIIKYFYKEPLSVEELKSIENLRFEYSAKAYYTIPLLIFCLEKYIIDTLK